jgi:long-chain fatty acid transport protein
VPASNTKIQLGGLTAAVFLVSAGHALAGGFAAAEISVKGMGRANAGEAADVGAAQLWWNPAAIARSPREISLGVQQRNMSSNLDDTGSTITRPIAPGGYTTPVGGQAHVSDGWSDFTALNGAIAMPLGDRFAVGLSVEQPFRLKGDYGATGWGRYDTVRNRIDITDVQATVAMRATDWLDLGVGIDGQYMKAALDTASPNLDPTQPDGLQSLHGDGWDYGWTVGAQAHLEQLTLGASYRSAIDHKITGTLALSGLTGPLAGANFSAPATTAFSTPWTATLAARWTATPALTLDAQIVRSGWSKYDAIQVGFAGQTAVIPQNYKDTTSVAVGADYVVAPSWTVRGGVQFDPTPTPNNLREPGVADSDRLVYAVGASHELAAGAIVHAAFAYTDFQGARIFDDTSFYAGTAAQTNANLRGNFSGHALTGALGVDWRF